MSDQYAEMKKNTVSSANQLHPSEYVYIEENGGKRIMFLGNSITLHGVLPSIGWLNQWGMAASAREKDYVHLTEAAVREKDENAAFCICQAALWEREYKKLDETYHCFAAAKDFGADIIIMRCMENCPAQDFDGAAFEKSLAGLLDYLNPDAKVIMTTPFWRHPGSDSIRALAKKRGYPIVELEDLGSMDEMKAIGLFEHSGVANHPGDRGMEAISERILKVLLPMLG